MVAVYNSPNVNNYTLCIIITVSELAIIMSILTVNILHTTNENFSIKLALHNIK